MPLSAKGREILSALRKEYGEKKAEQVLYAGENADTFEGIHDARDARYSRGQTVYVQEPAGGPWLPVQIIEPDEDAGSGWYLHTHPRISGWIQSTHESEIRMTEPAPRFPKPHFSDSVRNRLHRAFDRAFARDSKVKLNDMRIGTKFIYEGKQYEVAAFAGLSSRPMIVVHDGKGIKHLGPFSPFQIFEESGNAGHDAKDPAVMTAGEINREMDSLSKQSSAITRKLIDAGRGDERASEILAKFDPMSNDYRRVSNRQGELMREIERRYGPGAPSRLPAGFGPIKKI